ncbi:MAG: hypothetical protein ACOX7R_08400 [Acetivibrionales bacterium]
MNNTNYGPRLQYSEQVDLDLKKELLIPEMKTIDPVSYVSRLFRENFKPSEKSFKEFISKGEGNTIEKRSFYRKFSQICFERGLLSSAVLKGNGEVMMVAAFRHSLGFQSPANSKEQKIFESSLSDSNARHIKILHNDWVNSACAIVSDASKNASKVVSAFKTAVEEGDLPGRNGGSALENIMPFLSVKREYSLINTYTEKLNNLKRSSSQIQATGCVSNAAEIQIHVLKNAISKLNIMISKKKYLKHRFLTLLEYALSRVQKFQNELDSDTFNVNRIAASITGSGSGDEDGENKGDTGGEGGIKVDQNANNKGESL